ncbi:MAG TPA: class I SAM-dependent methyltransferase [Candidatus Binatia bacterium]|nr:class I SAM-dependent methyltransferase [Candidatus Binatia bacterium]
MCERHSGPGAKAGDRRFSPGAIDYDGTISENYPAGRALSSQTLELWLSAVDPFVKATRSQIILDLGAGTGRFSGLLAERFQARVIAVEPSRGMLAAATADQHSAHVAYVAGKAENLPLRDKSCDVAWLSQVFHHVRDHRACARELHRILRPDGRVLIRGAFGDRLDGFPTLFRFFPGTRLICEDLPTTKHSAAVFEAEGFTLEADRRIQQRTCASLREFAERTRLRADTALALISEQEFAQGLAALEQAAASEREPSPVQETLDLLVFRGVG